MTVFLAGKTCLSNRIFPENCFASGGLINLRLTFGNSFVTQKAVCKTLLSSVFKTVFWVKEEFPNVIVNKTACRRRKKFSGKIRPQVSSNLVSPPQVKKIKNNMSPPWRFFGGGRWRQCLNWTDAKVWWWTQKHQSVGGGGMQYRGN